MNYSRGDIATFYFIIYDNGNIKDVRAWTDNKKLAKYYMAFHNCSKFRIKKLTKPIEDINEIINESYQEEIKLANVITRNRKSGHENEAMYVQVPMTESELRFVRAENSDFSSTTVGYSYLYNAIDFLKGKYRDALRTLLLDDIITHVINRSSSPVAQSIYCDEISILVRANPEFFDE